MINDIEMLDSLTVTNVHKHGLTFFANLNAGGVYIGKIHMFVDRADGDFIVTEAVADWIHEYYEGDVGALFDRCRTLITAAVGAK